MDAENPTLKCVSNYNAFQITKTRNKQQEENYEDQEDLHKRATAKKKEIHDLFFSSLTCLLYLHGFINTVKRMWEFLLGVKQICFLIYVINEFCRMLDFLIKLQIPQ